MKVLRLPVVLICLIAGPVVSTYAQQQIPADLLITLKRDRCVWGCPTYSLEISATGSMKFTPLGEYEYVGRGKGPSVPIEDNIGPDRVAELFDLFRKIKFYDLLDRFDGDYGKSNPSCPEYLTDAPSTDVAIVADGKRKTINHYTGCRGSQVLNDLKVLERKIDEVARVSRWLSLFHWSG